MSEEDLMTRFLCDLSSLGLPVNEVDVEFRPYSKTYYGRYYPSVKEDVKKPRVVIYPYEENGEYMNYDTILENGVHEFIHHLQYVSGSFIRRKGVMHNEQFWKLYNFYMNRAYRFGLIQKRGEKVAY